DSSVDGSTAGSGPDTIVFDASLTAAGDATIRLSLFDTGEDPGEAGPAAFILSSPVTLEGSSGEAGITIAGSTNVDVRIFQVMTGATLRLSWLNLTDGFATGMVGRGGAVLNAGTTEVYHCSFSSNRAEAVDPGGYAAGGAIFNDGGQLIMKNCTLSGNSVFGAGGGGNALGGALAGNNGVIALTHCTVASNRCEPGTGGGVALGHGIYAMADSSNATLALLNTIVLGGTGGAYDLFATNMSAGVLVTTGGGNLMENWTGYVGGVTPATPHLEPLADNGGPTLTHALPTNSPAIDAGITSTLLHDQRGSRYPRIVDGDLDGSRDIDIGAYELAFLDF
ncbi:MAG: choice-of-anchor Q domain-containing protein, partial [Verrucomicrobiota bacterium]